MPGTTNPLLDSDALPHFEGVHALHVEPAIEELITLNKKALDEVLQDNRTSYTWETLVVPLDEAEDKLEKAWSVVSHLNSVANSDELRAAYEASQQKLTAFYSAVGQNKALFNAYHSLTREDYFETLSTAQQKAINNALRDFKLSGVALSDDDKVTFTDISQQLSSLTTQFANNVLDATQSWYVHIEDEAALKGIPELAKQAAKNAAADKELSGWVFTLDIPSYLAVVTHAQNRELREKLYTAYATRASDQSVLDAKRTEALDNSQTIEKILTLRQQKAKLLGFNNFAEVSIAPKMAQATQQVEDFLHDLAHKAKPQAEKELAELQAFAKTHFNLDKLEAWDVSFYSEKLKEKLFNVSQEAVREYFPVRKVLAGMFSLVESLYGIYVRPNNDISAYHDDVLVFDIERGGKKISRFYFDLYTREKKRGGAWMADARGKKMISGKPQTPVAFLVCNFSPPVGETPSLLTHNDVTTLFHEFGHGLHHMLTQVDVPAVSGISGVAWDAVELPSQFMENFCWEKSILPSISGHFKTGEAFPEKMLNNMIEGKNFQSAMQMVRQIEFSLFDFLLHKNYGQESFESVQHCIDEVRKKVAVIVPPRFNRFQNSFSHIFAGGYAAGYYSYKWAEVLSADVYSAFEEEGITNPKTGKRFLQCILEKGGSEDAMVLFEKFRGRKPSNEALLRHSGINAA